MGRVLSLIVKSFSTGISNTVDSAIARSSDGQCIPFANRALERRGHAERIDHRTLAVQRDEALARGVPRGLKCNEARPAMTQGTRVERCLRNARKAGIPVGRTSARAQMKAVEAERLCDDRRFCAIGGDRVYKRAIRGRQNGNPGLEPHVQA